jgi:cofilin
MASGIAVGDECVKAFNGLSKRSYSTIVFKINADMTAVVVDKTFPPSKGNFEAEWKDFIKTLPESDCRYIITDFSWHETATVSKSKICMVLWSPDYAPIRSKMIYASSQEAVTKLAPVQRSIQATEVDELAYKVVKDTVAK